jgi:outer membrane receptor for ferrienterochelin and colicin
MAGLRGEETMVKGNSENDAKDFSNSYFDLFPSATLKYNYKSFNDFQLSYSRRINRPGNQQLNPFTDYSDSLNVRTGNPKLKPEYINSYELTYMRKIREQSLSGTLYYRHTDNLMSRYRTIDTQTGVTTVSFQNYSSSENTGVEVVLRNQIGKNFNIMTSFNYYENKIKASNLEAELQSTSTNWNLRSTVNYKITPATSLQVSGNYMSPVKQPQGSFKGMSGVDAGIRQEFMKGKLALNINVSDIFNNRKFQIHNVGTGFDLDVWRKRESRIAMFTLSYRFGSTDASMSGKKRQQKMDMPQQDMNQGDF